ncbi:hypothetical protein TCAL_03918, partial [Tigriopus californicus]
HSSNELAAKEGALQDSWPAAIHDDFHDDFHGQARRTSIELTTSLLITFTTHTHHPAVTQSVSQSARLAPLFAVASTSASTSASAVSMMSITEEEEEEEEEKEVVTVKTDETLQQEHEDDDDDQTHLTPGEKHAAVRDESPVAVEEAEDFEQSPPPSDLYTRPGRSRVWNYCLKLTREASICNLCQTILNCRGSSTSSLTKHLKTQHHIDINAPLDPHAHTHPVPPTTPVPVPALPATRHGPKTPTSTGPWPYYDPLPNERARCKLCAHEVARTDGSTVSLISHLRTQHDIDSADQPPVPPALEPAGSRPAHLGLTDFTGSSLVWRYFDRIADGHTRCHLCHKILKRATGSTSNMIRHLRAKHEIELTAKPPGPGLDPLKDGGGSDPVTTYEGSEALWNHFQVGPHGQTHCRLCPKVLGPTGGSTAGMIKHLRMKHDLDKHGEPLPAGERSTQKSLVWRHFEEVSPTHAQCNQCHRIFKRTGGSTSTLLRHLRNKHDVQDEETGPEPESEDEDGMAGEHPDHLPSRIDHSVEVETDKTGVKLEPFPAHRASHRSPVWDFFQNLSNEKAACKLCRKILSRNGGCTSSLLKHLRSQHPNYDSTRQTRLLSEPKEEEEEEEILCPPVPVLEDEDDPVIYTTEVEDVEHDMKPLKSFVWNYFLPCRDGYATCRVCGKSLRMTNSSTSGLKRHLKARHNIDKGQDQSSVAFLVNERLEPEAEAEDIWSGVFEEHSPPEEENHFFDDDVQIATKRSWTGSHPSLHSPGKVSRTVSPKIHHSVDSGGKSLVWMYCEAIGKEMAQCNLCQKTLTTKCSSTSGLIRHLKRTHDINLSRDDASPDEHLGDLIRANSVKNRHLKLSEMQQNESATELLAKLISVDGFPVNGVLKSAYINEACLINSLTMPASTEDLVFMLIEHADELKAKAAQELTHMANIDLRFSLTLDWWPAEAGVVHMAVNCHSQGLSWSLGLIHEVQSLTEPAILEAVQKKVSEFGLGFERDIVACTMDSPFQHGVEEQSCLARGIHEAVREALYRPISLDKQVPKKEESPIFQAIQWSNVELIPEITEILGRVKTRVAEIFKLEPPNITMKQQYHLEKLASFHPSNSWEKLLEQLRAIPLIETSFQDDQFLPERDCEILKNLEHLLDLILSGLTSLNSKDVDLLSADNVINQLLEELGKSTSDYAVLLRQCIEDQSTQKQRRDIVGLLQYFNCPKEALASQQVSRNMLEQDIGLFSRRLFPNDSDLQSKAKEPQEDLQSRTKIIADGMNHFETTDCLSSDLKSLKRALTTISPTCRQPNRCSPHCGSDAVFQPFGKGHFSRLEDALIFLKGFYDQRS